ncbi:MAG: DUF1330 domain-containing protein [Pseudomonadota bacterium]
MSVYLIGTITIHDRARYTDYENKFMEVFEQFDGRILAVDENTQAVEGTWDSTRTVLMEFPSVDAASRWYESPEYQAIVQDRLASSEGNTVLVQGLAD